jgi:hypothetical protein
LILCKRTTNNFIVNSNLKSARNVKILIKRSTTTEFTYRKQAIDGQKRIVSDRPAADMEQFPAKNDRHRPDTDTGTLRWLRSFAFTLITLLTFHLFISI